MVVSSQFLLAKVIPQDIRGTVSGCFTIIGELAVLFYTIIGGIVYDEWFEGGPFVMLSIASGIFFVLCLIVFFMPSSDRLLQ